MGESPEVQVSLRVLAGQEVGVAWQGHGRSAGKRVKGHRDHGAVIASAAINNGKVR